MLNFQKFQEYVEMNLKEVLSEEYQDAVVSLNEVTKNNGTVLHAVTVRPEDSNIAPNIYLDGYFKKYEEGADIDIVMGEIGRVAMDNMRAPEEFASIGRDFQNFDFAYSIPPAAVPLSGYSAIMRACHRTRSCPGVSPKHSIAVPFGNCNYNCIKI